MKKNSAESFFSGAATLESAQGKLKISFKLWIIHEWQNKKKVVWCIIETWKHIKAAAAAETREANQFWEKTEPVMKFSKHFGEKEETEESDSSSHREM